MKVVFRHRATGAEQRAGERWARARGEPLVELRSVAARDPVLPAPVLPLHGEGGALLVSARLDRRGGRRLQGAARRARRRGDRDGRLPRGDRPCCRHVPGGHAAPEGSSQAARGALAHGGGAHRARGAVPLVPGGHRGNRAARSARPAAGRVRAADRGRRSRRAGGRTRRHGSRRSGWSTRCATWSVRSS